MNWNLASLVERFAGIEVAVIGEAMIDTYLDGSTHRLCQEAPVPVVDLSARIDVPGGAANVAVNVARLGGKVNFLSVIGRDAPGDLLRGLLQDRGIETAALLTRPNRHTLQKQRVVVGD